MSFCRAFISLGTGQEEIRMGRVLLFPYPYSSSSIILAVILQYLQGHSKHLLAANITRLIYDMTKFQQKLHRKVPASTQL